MAITKERKQQIVAQTKELFESSKLTLIVNYQGLSVGQFQNLRSEAKKLNVKIKVVKNRLFKQALPNLKLTDNQLIGMLVYVFSQDDEVSGAQIIKNFKNNFNYPLEFVCGIDNNLQIMTKEQVLVLADLPSQNDLLNQIQTLLQSPLKQTVSNLNSLPQILNNLKAYKN